MDSDIFAQRVHGRGNVFWTPGGLAVYEVTDEQTSPQIAVDASGSIFIAWIDHRNGNDDIYAHKLDPAGHAIWTAVNMPVCAASKTQSYQQAIPDETNGALITWRDD